jgi:energy-coupling factor transport system substrate-specific component
MKEIFSMWKQTKMVVLVALCAGLYAALLIPFKGFVIIPGITEVRPGSALPIVFGLLFGPAGAWGSAIGNLIGDFFGTIGIGSTFGFVGNFLFAYVPYKLWSNLFTRADDKEPNLKTARKVIAYIVVAICGSVACGLFIAWGLDILKLVPFAALGTIISLNNSIPSIILGAPLLIILYPRIKKWDLLWTDIMPEKDLPKNGKLAKAGAVILLLSIIVGFGGGLFAALGAHQAVFAAGFGAGGAGALSVGVIAGIGSIGMIISGILQN